MSGIWIVLSKISVLTWVLLLIGVFIFAIVCEVEERRAKKNVEEESAEDKDEGMTITTNERGVVLRCPESERCAAVAGILEAERECEQLRKEYDELRERNKNLRLARDEKAEALKSLEENYRALEEADNKLTAEYKELKKENEAHGRQLTQIMRSNPEVFEQFCGEDEAEQELIEKGYVVK